MIPRKTYIPHIPAFVYFYCFLQPKYTAVGSFSWHYFSVQFSALHYFIFSGYTNLNFYRMFSSTFQYLCKFSIKKYNNLTFLQQFFNTCYLFGINGANVCDTHISIATDDDITQFGDDVNIYPVYLSRVIIIF